jgi:hypothetical protein
MGENRRRHPMDFPPSAQQIKLPCFRRALLLCSAWPKKRTVMLEEAIVQIKACAVQMDARYGRVVFDEWAVISLLDNKARVLAYIGPRHDDFMANFANDLGTLRAGLLNADYGTGDFEFARHGTGTGFESFMVLGRALYLICNNTRETMDAITKNPRWLVAQKPFAGLGDTFRANPITGTGDDTKYFKKG